jgi:hypothetical protein
MNKVSMTERPDTYAERIREAFRRARSAGVTTEQFLRVIEEEYS